MIGKNLVDAKILAAAPRILEQNAAMVKGMLEYIKPLVAEATPLGPGHFGYHLRDRFTTEVKAEGVRTVGVLKSPPTGYWREFGTQSHFHNAHGRLRSYVAAIGGFGGGGERAFMTAHKAASGVQRLIKFYYGGLAAWWRAQMAGFQADVLDHIAQVVGGTVSSTIAHFYSGAQAGDGTGVSGLKGCWSQAPGGITQTPIAIVLPGAFTDTLLGGQGKEEADDQIKLLLLVAKYDPKSQFGILTPYRDSVSAAFRSHMQAFAIPDVIDCFVTNGTSGIHNWGGIEYLAWDFTIRVRRLLSVTYTA